MTTEIRKLQRANIFMLGALRAIVAETKGKDGLNHLYGTAQAAIDLAELGPNGCAEMRGDKHQN